MTKVELVDCLRLVALNFNKDVDEALIGLWTGLFIKFDLRMFQKACSKIIIGNKFFTKKKEMIDMYQSVKQEAQQKHYEQMKASQKLLAMGQGDCFLCGNTGWCFYRREGYEFASRCICPRGVDLNKFSNSQIKKDFPQEPKENYSSWDNAKIKRGENPFYIRTIQEALGGDFEIYSARKKAAYLSQKNLSEEEKAKLLKNLEIGIRK